MIIYDFTHAYQPFEPPSFIPSWVEENLKDVMLPVSRAMKEGGIKRYVQLQGWTIDAYLKAPKPIQNFSREFLENLRIASTKGNIQLGFSAYSHPILPFLSDEVLVRSIYEDYQIVSKYLGEPTWFWFPEGACDKRTLQLVLQEFPEVYAVIPDGCMNKANFSGFFKIDSGGKVVVCNSILKDIFMNALDYKQPQSYTPRGLSWEVAGKMISDGKALLEGLEYFTDEEFVVLTRDLENAGSKYGLFEYKSDVKELQSFYQNREKLQFDFIQDDEFKETFKGEDIRPSSWEPFVRNGNPYPYWNLPSWITFVQTFCDLYRENWTREQLIVLASDVPWHILARREWNRFPRHSLEFVQRVVIPMVQEIGKKDLIMAARTLHKDLQEHI